MRQIQTPRTMDLVPRTQRTCRDVSEAPAPSRGRVLLPPLGRVLLSPLGRLLLPPLGRLLLSCPLMIQQFLRQRLQATPLISDATKPLKMALNVRGILALRSNSTTTSKAQDTPSSRSVRFVPLPAHYGKCSRNSAYMWRGATQDNSLTQKSLDVRNHSARADRGNNSRSSSSTLARSIQTFHASKPRNKLADTDEIESKLLG